jgi:hypothetical protein
MRNRAGALIIAVLTAASLAVGVAGSAGASTAEQKSKKPLCAGKTKKKAITAIEDAYAHFLDGATYPDALEDKAPYIQYLSGKKFSQEFLDKFVASSAANAEAAATTNVDIDKVTCKSKTSAEVIFTLVISGGRLDGLAPPGGAVLEGKTWKVSGLTLCNTQALGDPTTLETEPCATIVLEELI